MTSPQAGIFALGTRIHRHLELDVYPNASPDDLATALAMMRAPDVSGGGANLVVGLGAPVWRELFPDRDEPHGLGAFTPVDGHGGMHAPATQHDLWVWVHGSSVDDVHETVTRAARALEPVATIAQEVPCFVYKDSRDLTGFVDGTANPAPVEAPAVACVPGGQPGEGGSHVMVQRWVHDLDAFAELAVADQERVIGRTKLDSTELPPSERPSDAHISLAEIHDSEGEERPIFRRSTPWGTATERGLLFVAFSAERDRFDCMLAQLFGVGERSQRDHLLDFTRAVSGAYYFAPSIEDLCALAPAIGSA